MVGDLGLAAVDTLVTVIVDPKAFRVDLDEAEIGLLESSCSTPPGVGVSR